MNIKKITHKFIASHQGSKTIGPKLVSRSGGPTRPSLGRVRRVLGENSSKTRPIFK